MKVRPNGKKQIEVGDQYGYFTILQYIGKNETRCTKWLVNVFGGKN